MFAVGLVLVGLVVALTKVLPPISLTHDVAFFLILPPILFQGAMHLHWEHLKNDWKLVALLAIPGVIVCALLVGYPLYYFWHIPLIYALLFGALISPTDPVSVLAILKKIRAPDRLRTMLEAESLFNDGTGVVLFMVIFSMIQSNQPLNVPYAVGQFSLVTGGGAVIGGLCGYLAYQIIKHLDNRLLQVGITVVLTFGTPVIAETLHCSGIIAIVVAGLVMGKKRLKTIETFWKAIDLIMNSLVFLLIGIQLQVIGANNLFGFKESIGIGIVIVLISRVLVVYPTLGLFNRHLKPPIPFVWNHILFWGGLRGTIPILLALQLPEFPYRSLFLTATFGIVLFSLIIQGLTIEPLLKKLKLQK